MSSLTYFDNLVSECASADIVVLGGFNFHKEDWLWGPNHFPSVTLAQSYSRSPHTFVQPTQSSIRLLTPLVLNVQLMDRVPFHVLQSLIHLKFAHPAPFGTNILTEIIQVGTF